jgi:helicase
MIDIEDFIAKNDKNFLEEVPEPFDYEYELFTRSLKTANLLNEWISEKTEDQLLEKYGITPGELYTKTTNGGWLLYAAEEFAKVKGNRKIAKELRKLQLRMKNGIKDELLDLIRIKGIGRVKARRLYNSGVKKVSDLRKIDRLSAERLIGKKTLMKILGK